MLVEKTKEYYAGGMNCAETLILAGNDAYNLGLDAKTAKALAGFGAGCGCGSLCGALAGALATISSLAVQENAHSTPGFGPLCAEFMAKYEAEMGSHMCNELKAKYRSEEAKCLKTCELSAEVLKAFVEEKGLAK